MSDKPPLSQIGKENALDIKNYRDQHSEEIDFDELLDDPEVRAAMDDAETRMNVADLLRAGRKAAGYSQKDVAQAMGTTQSAVSDLERGETDPQLSTLQRYARATGAQLKIFVALPQQPLLVGGTYNRVSEQVTSPVHDSPRPRLRSVPSYHEIRVS